MNCRLVLYLKGVVEETVNLQLPDHNDEFDFETNVEIRKQFVIYNKEVLKAMKSRKIFVCGGDYDIAAVFESKVDGFVVSDDSLVMG